MSRSKTYQVIESFNPKKDYGVKLENRFKTTLSEFHKGDTFRPKDIVNRLPKSNQTLAYDTISCGVKLGMIKLMETEPSKFEDFCNQETVQYFAEQLRGFKFKHKETNSSDTSTRKLYLYKLWRFNNWIIGKKFRFKRQIRISMDTLKETDDFVELQGAEHLLKLYQESHTSDTEFVRIIKSFLMDAQHENTKASTVDLFYCAIRAYFDRNDSPINFKFNTKAKYEELTDDQLILKPII